MSLFYELFAILVFFPKTLWLLLRHPQRMMDYADAELGDVLNQQYNDTISPPKFMMLCLGVGYLGERALDHANLQALPEWMRDWEILLSLRMLMFSIIPLVMALRLVRLLNEPLDRETLRPPFYSQCYLGGALILINVAITSISKISFFNIYILYLVIFASFSWYFHNQILWFQNNLCVGYLKAARITFVSALIALTTIACLTALAFVM